MTSRSGLKPGQVKLERALSKLGIASRGQAREWILAGQVKVNGIVRRSPAFPVVPERAKIEVADTRVQAAKPRTFLFHKPKGVITTRSDEKGRKNVFDFFEKEGIYLTAVGRLDGATTGLLLLTNDNQLANRLTDPKFEVPRTYLVTVRGLVTPATVTVLKQGILDQGEHLACDEVRLRKSSRRESHLTVTLREGKNREIRRLFVALGHEVTALKRVAYGSIELGKLAPGEYRELSAQEIQTLDPKSL